MSYSVCSIHFCLANSIVVLPRIYCAVPTVPQCHLIPFHQAAQVMANMQTKTHWYSCMLFLSAFLPRYENYYMYLYLSSYSLQIFNIVQLCPLPCALCTVLEILCSVPVIIEDVAHCGYCSAAEIRGFIIISLIFVVIRPQLMTFLFEHAWLDCITSEVMTSWH